MVFNSDFGQKIVDLKLVPLSVTTKLSYFAKCCV